MKKCFKVKGARRRLASLINSILINERGKLNPAFVSIIKEPNRLEHLYDYPGFDLIRFGTIELLSQEIKRNNVAGQCAELGVYKGELSRMINILFPDRKLYLFDTFEGFDKRDISVQDELGVEDVNKYKTAFKDTSVEKVLSIMPNKENVIVKKGFFPQSLEEEGTILEDKYCFVSLDCDLYAPILDGLKYFYPRLEKGGYIVIHDYNQTDFGEGIHQAVDDYRKTNELSIVPLIDDSGSLVITKPL